MWEVWGPIIAVILSSYLGLAAWLVKRLFYKIDKLDECVDKTRRLMWEHLAEHHPSLAHRTRNRWTT